MEEKVVKEENTKEKRKIKLVIGESQNEGKLREIVNKRGKINLEMLNLLDNSALNQDEKIKGRELVRDNIDLDVEEMDTINNAFKSHRLVFFIINIALLIGLIICANYGLIVDFKQMLVATLQFYILENFNYVCEPFKNFSLKVNDIFNWLLFVCLIITALQNLALSFGINIF